MTLVIHRLNQILGEARCRSEDDFEASEGNPEEFIY